VVGFGNPNPTEEDEEKSDDETVEEVKREI